MHTNNSPTWILKEKNLQNNSCDFPSNDFFGQGIYYYNLSNHDLVKTAAKENKNVYRFSMMTLYLKSESDSKKLIHDLKERYPDHLIIYHKGNDYALAAAFANGEEPKVITRINIYALPKLNSDIVLDVSVSDSALFANITTTEEKYISSFKEFLQSRDYISATPPFEDNIQIIVRQQNNFRFKQIEAKLADFEPRNYTEDVVSGFEYVCKQLTKENPVGRLVILEGEPGTGKTYLTKAMAKKYLNTGHWLFIPSNMIYFISSPDFIPLLVSKKTTDRRPLFMIVEDADELLVPRGVNHGSMTGLSALLNCTDGILGECLDLRIIATTNQKLDRIDSALKRPGRLLKHMHVPLLPTKQANKVYERLTSKKETIFSKRKVSLAEVYSKASNAEVPMQEIEKSTIGF